MTYHNALKYLASAPLSYPEGHSYARLEYLLHLLHDPHKSMRYIRLAGSSGKTICGMMLSEIFQRTPHAVGTVVMSEFKDPRAAIRVGTEAISMEDVSTLFSRISLAVAMMKRNVALALATKNAFESENSEPIEDLGLHDSLINGTSSCDPTASEIILLTALLYFQEKNCSLCMVESNHQDDDASMLLPTPMSVVICGTVPKGNTEEMARVRRYMKRGIREIISAPQDGDAYRSLSDTCATVHCRLSIPARSSFHVQRHTMHGITFLYRGREYRLRLCGLFEMINAGTVIETVSMLRRFGFSISNEAEEAGLAATVVPARFEVLSAAPYIVVDSTYQADAIDTICSTLQSFKNITGCSIKLCMDHDVHLAELYEKKLRKYDFDVERILLVSEKGREAHITRLKNAVCVCGVSKAVRQTLQEIGTDDFWLVVGKSDFALPMRYELLRQMGY